MLVNLKHDMMHDSSMPEYRQPAGAVKTGGQVALRFRTRLQDVQCIYIRLFNEAYEDLYRMQLTDGVWSAEFAVPEQPGVYWYYFRIHMDAGECYYGVDGGRTSGMGSVYSGPPPAFQLTVYDKLFDTPAWLQKSVMYQIFPDRFKRSEDMAQAQQGIAWHQGLGRKAYLHADWSEAPFYKPQPGERDYAPNDYFGGTLKGIEESLPYFKELGVGVIYLNPVFEAASNHRYNTADYLKIDPVLGTDADFRELCAHAAEMGMRIVLDGVFSHTGSDSIYFNREGAYEGPGAYQSQASPYFPWYKFDSYPDKYKCWWGFKTLPEVNEHEESWQQFMIGGEDAVLKHWIGEGAAGYRLDVADELPDDVLALMRSAVKAKDPDAVLIGEVWEDATTKHSYGVHRKYAFGRELDSVTNYPFRNALVSFLTGKTDAHALKDFFIAQAVNYPRPFYYALMNLLSSHDIERIRTALSVRIDPHELTREQQAGFAVSDSQNKKGALLQRLAAAIQMSVPGVPCIYYGDEVGMQGLLDPFNRAPFQKGAYDLTKYYAKLCGIRNRTDALTVGHAAFLAPASDCIGILRYIVDGKDAMGNPAENGIYFTAVNRAERTRRVVFDFAGSNALMSEEEKLLIRKSMYSVGNCLMSEDSYEVNDGLMEMSLQPYGYALLKLA